MYLVQEKQSGKWATVNTFKSKLAAHCAAEVIEKAGLRDVRVVVESASGKCSDCGDAKSICLTVGGCQP